MSTHGNDQRPSFALCRGPVGSPRAIFEMKRGNLHTPPFPFPHLQKALNLGTCSRFWARGTTIVVSTHGNNRRPVLAYFGGSASSPQPIFDKSSGHLPPTPVPLSGPPAVAHVAGL